MDDIMASLSHCLIPGGLYYQQGWVQSAPCLFMAWISNHIRVKERDVITHACWIVNINYRLSSLQIFHFGITLHSCYQCGFRQLSWMGVKLMRPGLVGCLVWETLLSSLRCPGLNLLWPSHAIWRYRSGSTFAQVIAGWLIAPSH